MLWMYLYIVRLLSYHINCMTHKNWIFIWSKCICFHAVYWCFHTFYTTKKIILFFIWDFTVWSACLYHIKICKLQMSRHLKVNKFFFVKDKNRRLFLWEHGIKYQNSALKLKYIKKSCFCLTSERLGVEAL